MVCFEPATAELSGEAFGRLVVAMIKIVAARRNDDYASGGGGAIVATRTFTSR